MAGTTNRTEFLLGDSCRYGDGGTDIEPIAHLYKNQVFQLADHLNVLPEIVHRQPSPDTFSLPVTNQEFFFRIPFDRLDHLLYGWEHQIPESEVGRALGLPEDAVRRAYKDFTTEHRATAHLRVMPVTVEKVEQAERPRTPRDRETGRLRNRRHQRAQLPPPGSRGARVDRHSGHGV